MRKMRQWVLASRPDGLAKTSDFRLEEVPRPVCGAGEVLLQTLYMGVAPVMLRYMTNDTQFERDLNLGDVMHGRGVARIVQSRNKRFHEGDVIHAKLGWREYAIIDDDAYYMPFRMGHTDLRLSYGVSALGFNGFTSLIGMRDIANVHTGDRVLVSGAAGSVGSNAAFVARALGAKQVVGIAGGQHKCRTLTERLGYDAAIDYKGEDVAAALDQYFADGIDVFFDNVGGELLDEVLGRIRRRARITLCGRISEYLKNPEDYHRPRNLYRLALMDSKMEGFFVYDYANEFVEHEATLAGWIRQGLITPLEDLLEGIESLPEALLSLYEGSNIGARIVRIGQPAE